MFYLLKSNKAFNRTSPHPADPAVRIAHHEDDLAALHYRNKARAVIFKRELPQAVIDELKNYNVRRPGITQSYGPAVQIHPFKKTFNQSVNAPNSLNNSPALMADMAYIASVFCKAAGRTIFNRHYGLKMTEWLLDMDDPQTFARYNEKLAPHTDGPLLDPRRLTCAYTENPAGMGTAWFPGTFNSTEVKEITEELRKVNHAPETLKKYHYQTTDAGDLIFFHTNFPQNAAQKDERKLSLLHASPKPPANKPRLLLLLPT